MLSALEIFLGYALYKFTFYLLTTFTYCTVRRTQYDRLSQQQLSFLAFF